MAEPKDVLSRALVIGAQLDASGISVQVKSRAVLALDRLIGSLVDLPAAMAEGATSKRRLRTQIEERLLMAQAEVAEQKVRGLAGIGDTLVLDLLKEAARKQGNTASVALEAIAALKSLPPPQAEDDKAASIGEDWMNYYVRIAEDASSEDLQGIWGRVLAGEINSVGSYSRQTLRFISELDSTTARHCEYAANRNIEYWIAKHQDCNKSEQLMIGVDLERLGLLYGLTGSATQQTFTFDNHPKTFLKGTYVLCVYAPAGTRIAIDVILVTRMGQEVFSLLSPTDEKLRLREIASSFQKPGITRIELGRYAMQGTAGFQFFLEETVWTA